MSPSFKVSMIPFPQQIQLIVIVKECCPELGCSWVRIQNFQSSLKVVIFVLNCTSPLPAEPCSSYLCPGAGMCWLLFYGDCLWWESGFRSTFTLLDKLSFQRQKGVKPCPAADGCFDKRPNEENLCKSPHTLKASLTHLRSTWIRMQLHLNGSLCGHEKGLCEFMPGLSLLANVQWLNWWHGVFTDPCQTSESPTKKKQANSPQHHINSIWKDITPISPLLRIQ